MGFRRLVLFDRPVPAMQPPQRWHGAPSPVEAWGGMKTKVQTQPAAPVAPAAGIKRINLAGVATKSSAAKATKAYPVLPDEDGQVAALVEGILDIVPGGG